MNLGRIFSSLNPHNLCDKNDHVRDGFGKHHTDTNDILEYNMINGPNSIEFKPTKSSEDFIMIFDYK